MSLLGRWIEERGEGGGVHVADIDDDLEEGRGGCETFDE